MFNHFERLGKTLKNQEKQLIKGCWTIAWPKGVQLG